MKIKHFLFLLPLVAGLAAGCGKGARDAQGDGKPAHHHEHVPPHGGTAVELGEEENHLELIADTAGGKLTAYVMDGELEKFVRIAALSFEVIAHLPAGEQTLAFKPVPNPATGETVGDTSQFETRADWLKTTATFDATLKRLEIHGKTYESVKFNYPKGNEDNQNKK